MSLDLLRDIPGFLYLASPYTLYQGGRHLANLRVCGIAQRMRAAGLRVFSPIKHSHEIAEITGIDPLSPIWMEINRHFMRRAGALVVARMEGWRASIGIREEIGAFQAVHKPIFFLDVETTSVLAQADFERMAHSASRRQA